MTIANRETTHLAAILVLLVAIGIEVGCYPVRAYHQNAPILSLPPGNITLAYIEFDDNGEIFSRNELDLAIRRIEELESSTPNGINVIVFIHGWKNNADNTSNVAGFQYVLTEINNFYHLDPTPLVGVYIGWRGASLRIAKDLTYWNRSAATLRVAGAHLEEALYRIMVAVKSPPPTHNASSDTPAGTTGRPRPSSNLIFIGHSFGGRVLERAMTPYLEGMMLAADEGHLQGCQPALAKPETATGPLPDLTVLLNEAAPATDAKQFLEFLKCHQIPYQRDDPGYQMRPVNYPLFLSITSDGDAATSIALPIGQTAARRQLKTRPYDAPDPPEIPNQSTYFTHSAANIPALHSHELRRQACGPGELEVHLAYDHPVVHLGPGNPVSYHLCEVPDPAHRVAGSPYWNHTPYWIFKIPVAIVPDHSNVFRPELVEFLRFFLPSEVSLKNPKKYLRSQKLMERQK